MHNLRRGGRERNYLLMVEEDKLTFSLLNNLKICAINNLKMCPEATERIEQYTHL